jgi:hypothetical protein
LYKQIDILNAKREQEKRQYALEVSQFNMGLTATQKTSIRSPSSPPEPPSWGVSSAQSMNGEDLQQKERMKKQQQQMKDWANQQMLEKQERARREKEMERFVVQITRLYWRFCRNIVADDHRSSATMLRQNLQYNLHFIEHRMGKVF